MVTRTSWGGPAKKKEGGEKRNPVFKRTAGENSRGKDCATQNETKKKKRGTEKICTGCVGGNRKKGAIVRKERNTVLIRNTINSAQG